jgi:F0F1-type ATP synthase membrane subunit a
LLLTWIFTVIMFVFELIVAVVQSFVFSLLSSVYISEV